MITLVGRDEILPLRWAVLRPGLPRETAEYPEDEHPAVFHLAVRDGEGTVVSCVTFFPDPLPERLTDPAEAGAAVWRLRGMATAASRRNLGVGGELLEAGVAEVARRGGALVWCNGRSGAAGFYRRHGFASRGEEFELAPAGPHYVFVRAV